MEGEEIEFFDSQPSAAGAQTKIVIAEKAALRSLPEFYSYRIRHHGGMSA